MTRIRRGGAVWSALILVLGCTAIARGAEQPSSDTDKSNNNSDELSTITVTAQFRKESLQDTPIAITAVNAEMLEQRNQTSIADVAGQAPNVTLKQQGVAFGPSLVASIRGIGQYDFNPAVEPGVGLYVDDVYYSTLTGSVLDLLDLDRVEILRGPQGTLAGKNSIGGAVKLYSQKPTGEGGGAVEVLYGSRNHVEARGSTDFAIVPDHLFMRVSGVVNHQDGYVDVVDYGCSHPGSGLPVSFLTHAGSCELGQEGGKSYGAIRMSLRWVLNDNLEATFIGDITHDTSENPANVLLYANNPNPNVALNGIPYDSRFVSPPYVNYSTYTMPAAAVPVLQNGQVTLVPTPAYQGSNSIKLVSWGGSAQVNWKISDTLALTSISAERGYTTDWFEDEDASPLPLSLGGEHLAHHQFSQELRLNGSAGKLLDYTVGGFYFRQMTIYGTHQDLLYVAPGFDFVGNDPVEAHTRAAFLHTVWHLADKLDFTAAVRYTKEDKDYTFVRRNPDGSANLILGSLDGLTGHYAGSKTDYRGDIDYHWTDDLMTYAQVSTGFKGGGVNPRPFFPFQVQSFNPETLTNYEVGLKSSWLEHTVRLNVAAFFGQYKNIQLTLLNCDFVNPPGLPGPLPCALPFNAGDAHIKGAELETEIHPLPGLELDASASYLSFDYTRLSSFPTGVQPGMVTPYTPKRKGSAGIQYSIPISYAGSFTPRFDVSYQDKIFTNAVNSPNNRLPGYSLMNARLTWKSDKEDWQAALEVLNLTNKLYYLSGFDLTSVGEGSIMAQPGPTREFAFSVKRRF